MHTVSSNKGIISTTNHLASSAAIEIINNSGNAIDAAIAASGVLSVTSQHQCGLGGDLFALIYKNGSVFALNSSGHSGSYLEEYSKEQNHKKINIFKDKRLVTIPGAVDGWLELNKKFGSKKMDEVLKRSIELSRDGFSCDQSLLNAINNSRNIFKDSPLNSINKINQIVRRPEISEQLQIISKYGRSGFYEGIFGEEFSNFLEGSVSKKDLKNKQSQWVKPISYNFFGEKFWTIPPNSQAFLIIETLRNIKKNIRKFPKNIKDLQLQIINEMLVMGNSRDDYLSNFLNLKGHDTNYMCIVDNKGLGVSLVQSNAHGFGSNLILKKSGVFLHNRGLGFIRNDNKFYPKNNTKPPSTLCPLIITKKNDLSCLVGTMGADSQPQIILQNWANNIFFNDVFTSLSSPRWIIGGNEKEKLFPFNSWKRKENISNLFYEKGISKDLLNDLSKNKFKFVKKYNNQNLFGHSQMIVKKNKIFYGHHDPRSITGSTIAL